MMTKIRRRIIKIDEAKSDGSGACVPACVEGALHIVDGKAKLITEKYCDGLGACLVEYPQGAIIIEEREAEDFDQEAARRHLEGKGHAAEQLPCGCPSTAVTQFERPEARGVALKMQSPTSRCWLTGRSNLPLSLPLCLFSRQRYIRLTGG